MICDDVALLFPTFHHSKRPRSEEEIKAFIRVIRYFYKNISFAVRKPGSLVPLPIRGSI